MSSVLDILISSVCSGPFTTEPEMQGWNLREGSTSK